MKHRTFFLALPFTVFAVYILVSSFIQKEDKIPSKLVKEQFTIECDSFTKQVIELNRLVLQFKQDSMQLGNLKAAYLSCRIHYKKIEPLLEYYFPATAKSLNGALVNESDEEEGTQTIIEPEGMQIIEEIIFSPNPSQKLTALETNARRIKAVTTRLPVLNKASDFGDFQIMDAIRMEVIRIMSLSITGFDSPASGNELKEIKSEIEGIQAIIHCYKTVFIANDRQLYTQLNKQLLAVTFYIGQAKNLNDLNKYVLVRDYLVPLYSSITKIFKSLRIEILDLPSPIHINAPSIFSNSAINTNYFNPNHTPVNKDIISLGKTLFFDPILSGNTKRACASCHNPEIAFTDKAITSAAFASEGNVSRNAPTIINVGFQSSYFYDSRANYLEDQIREVTNNRNELHGDLVKSASILQQSQEYTALFKTAFKGKTDTIISLQSIIKAISAYERSLIAMNSKFDRNIRREKNDFTKNEINGFNLFMGKAQCATCHFIPMFNGTVPPAYTKTEWEILGVPQKPDTINATIDQDMGRFIVNGMELNKYAFKTTTVRNSALTAPYMHNGVYKTLEDVVDFYARGGGNGIGLKLETQTLPFDKLELTGIEKKDLVSFLKTLTDTTGCNSVPSKLPSFNNPVLDKRKIGGEY